MMQISRRFLRLAAGSMILCGTIGCTTLPEDKLEFADGTGSPTSFVDRLPWIGKGKEAEEPYPNPVKMAATWTPDVLVQSGRTPTRGFGGRLFFYDERSRSVPVEGTLVVHGFDDTASDPAGQMKRFVFTPEQFTRHFSQSDLGASYSVWIPWDAAGGVQKKISLVATFESTAGKVVQGVPTSVLLPGSTPSADERLADSLSPQYRKWQLASQGGSVPSSGLTTTTIPRRSPRFGPNINGGPGEAGDGNGRVMVAGKKSTPSHDIQVRRPSRRVNALPASARLPSTSSRH